MSSFSKTHRLPSTNRTKRMEKPASIRIQSMIVNSDEIPSRNCFQRRIDGWKLPYSFLDVFLSQQQLGVTYVPWKMW